MDSRTALKKGTKLRFKDGQEYRILGELARGGSGIVYNAYYLDNMGERKTVRIKECYPFKCKLTREEGGALGIPESEQRLFAETLQKMRRAYQLGNEFFSTDGLTNLTANTYNIYETNHTLYVISAYVEGQELSYGRYARVKDCITAVKSAAHAMSRIHRKGFLYLDIKPANILTLEGTTELVQLFDFDTVVPISQLTEAGDRISFTRGFAALELQRGDYRHMGRHTDVYGIGALLFYLLFGRVPDAFDCEADAIYDFSQSLLAGATYPDALAFRLTDFFHHTLADYYLDRFSHMETVEEKLTELQALSDLSARYIVSTKITTSDLFLGRGEEEEWMRKRLQGSTDGCFFVVGMGGIGKSSLVRHCLKQWEGKLDALLYLDASGRLEEAICDDYGAHIHGVQWDRTETEEEYFTRKLGILRELGKDKNCILVLDNYHGEAGTAFPRLLQLGWQIILISRDPSISQGYDTLSLGPIGEEEALLSLFAGNLGRSLQEEEEASVRSIIRAVEGHTLVLELLAKQIGSPLSSLSLAQAAQMVAKGGFSDRSSGKVTCRRDDILYQASIRQIIAGLFQGEALSKPQRILMRILALFGRVGVLVDQICDMLALKTREDISTLYEQGWIYVRDARITLHPVIGEVVSDWKVSPAGLEAADKVLQYLSARLQKVTEEGKAPQRKAEAGKEEALWLAAGTGREESCQAVGGEKQEVLRLAAALLEGGKGESQIQSSPSYRALLYHTIRNMPYEREEFLQEKAEEFIELFDRGGEESTERLLKIYGILLEILYDQGELGEARRRLRRMRASLSSHPGPRVLGRYYYLLTGFYDSLLDGAYAAKTEEEGKLLRLSLKTVDRAIHWLKLSAGPDAALFLGECYRLKALLLIRSGLGGKKQIRAILGRVRGLIDQYAKPYSQLERDYDMAMAWYYTYTEEDYRKTCAYMRRAMDITDRISRFELVRIDEQLSPVANILLEWKQYDKAAECLLGCISICEKYPEILPYARRQVDLLGYLLDVYLYAKEYDKCKEVIGQIDARVEAIGSLRAEDYVPEQLRKEIMMVTGGRGKMA